MERYASFHRKTGLVSSKPGAGFINASKVKNAVSFNFTQRPLSAKATGNYGWSKKIITLLHERVKMRKTLR